MNEHQYPLGTLIPYGPDLERATKMVASVIPALGAGPSVIERWHVKHGDIRKDIEVAREIAEFFATHKIASQITAPDISGCEHEEGVDFPLGAFCTKCAMWAALEGAKSHRTGKTEEGNGKFITADEVIAALAEVRGCPPEEAFKAAEFHREALIEPLIAGIEHGMTAAENHEDFDSQLGCHGLYLLGKWRESRCLPAVLRWFSLPEEAVDDFSGDTLLQSGAVILASIAGRDIPEIRAIIEDHSRFDYSRGVAVDSLGVLVQWGLLDRAEFIAYLRELITEKLERECNAVWNHVATLVADLGLKELLPELRAAGEEGMLDDTFISWDEIERAANAGGSKYLQEIHQPITDVADESSWWACYGRTAVEAFEEADEQHRAHVPREPYVPSPPAVPFIAEAKIGRNDPCPCNSGKKYKKCCGGS